MCPSHVTTTFTSNAYGKHKAAKHDRKVVCPHCAKGFATEYYMKRHGCRSQPVAAATAAVTRLLGVGNGVCSGVGRGVSNGVSNGVDRSSWDESSADESELLPEVVTLEVDRSVT